jgi:hypothetical protein
MTLREVLQNAIPNKIYRYIHKKDSKYAAKCDRPTFKQVEQSYMHVIKELLSKPKAKPYKLPWLVQISHDPFDNKSYVDVCFSNPDYVEPPKGAKPWGCNSKKDIPPKGHYNCNDDKYNKTFAAGWVPWSKVIDTPIINETELPLETMVAEILWEMTFYGWSEEKTEVHVKEIKGKIKESLAEIKEGKCVELPPAKKGGMKVVIPDNVSKFFIDEANRFAKKKRKRS